MTKEVKQEINRLLKQEFCLMIEHRDGKVYWLRHHWKHIEWKRDAQRVLLGKSKLPNQYQYLTDEI